MVWNAVTSISLMLAIAGCVTEAPPTEIVSLVREGSYHFKYTGPDAVAVEDAHDSELFNSPTTSPQGHIGLWRRTGTTLELAVGNVLPAMPIPTAGVCPLVVEARLWITGIEEADGDVPIDATNARMVVYTDAPTSGTCRRAVSAADPAATSREVTVTGKLTLDGMRCLSAPGPLGCAMKGRVGWNLQGVDGAGTAVVLTSGELVSRDVVAD